MKQHRIGARVSVLCACGLLWACSGDAAPSARMSKSFGSKPSGAGLNAGPAAPPGPPGTGAPTVVAALAPAPGSAMPVSQGTQPVNIDQCDASNPAGLADADLQTLIAGGSATGMRWLYPYDGTVFPRGLLAPTLMWEGGAATAVMIHIKAKEFEYKACVKPTAAGQLLLPQDVWDKAGARTLGPTDPYSLELTSLVNGVAAGPIVQRLVFAQATIKGSIFYNSYSSHLITGQQQGAVLRIPAGGQAELFVSTNCNGCHSVSADGSRLLSQAAGNGGQSFQLTPGSMPNPMAMNAGPSAAFGALYPNGSVYLSTSTMIEVARARMVSARGSTTAATLYETDTGTVIANTGIPEGALMPMFSPDGKLLVFNDYAINQAHGLALMDFDIMSRKAANRRVLFTDTTLRPGWPFVLPDDQGVVFTRTDGRDFSGEGAGLPADARDPGRAMGAGGNASGMSPKGPVSDLYMVDVKTGTSAILARAMGYDTPADAQGDTTYLPFGTEELHENYFPTVSPVGAGGYFWVFFDSVRHYGNQGMQRQLWGAAVEIAADGDYSLDRSHPAFYLPGQEFGTGNHRAFAALDPCKQDGNTCTSGVDCCGGFCHFPTNTPAEFGVEPVGMCSSDVPTCAKTGERCTTTADCCLPEPGQPQNTCIAGYCTFLNPVQ
jgi:hypothetical protein